MGTDRTRPTTDEADRHLLADIAGAKATHTPGPWTIAAGSHVCGGWSGMVRVEANEDFHSNGQDYPDGGSTKSYTNVVCGISGHSDTARANARLIAEAPALLRELRRAVALIEADRDMVVRCETVCGECELDDSAKEAVAVFDAVLIPARAAIAKAGGAA